MIKFLYKKILKPILFLFNPEKVHNVFVLTGELLGKFSFGRFLIGSIYNLKESNISKTVDGINYRHPIILSAGFDYNGKLSEILPFMSFGGEEIGSVTARKSEGNKKPRLKRLIKNKSILVNKGLRNDGVDKIIERLKSKKNYLNFIRGISIARTNDSLAGESVEEGIKDYYYSLTRLVKENIGDYYTINISCPNAFCGETFADSPEVLEQLLVKLKEVKTNKPIYIKLPINKDWELVEKLITEVIKNKYSGVVIGNLNKDRKYLDYPEEVEVSDKGNLSGKPCFELSNELIKKTRQKFGNKITIIGVGGILTPKDAITKFEAGADLIQLITGMIMEGPHLIKEICLEYEQFYGTKS